jgi:hypothetical protein
MRSIFLPIRKLEEYADRLADGAEATKPPKLSADLDTLAISIYRIVLRSHEPTSSGKENKSSGADT